MIQKVKKHKPTESIFPFSIFKSLSNKGVTSEEPSREVVPQT